MHTAIDMMAYRQWTQSAGDETKHCRRHKKIDIKYIQTTSKAADTTDWYLNSWIISSMMWYIAKNSQISAPLWPAQQKFGERSDLLRRAHWRPGAEIYRRLDDLDKEHKHKASVSSFSKVSLKPYSSFQFFRTHSRYGRWANVKSCVIMCRHIPPFHIFNN